MTMQHEKASQPTRRPPDRWTTAQLMEPSSAGFVHIAASSGRWRLPVAPVRNPRRAALLDRLHEAADVLGHDPRVARVDVFSGFVRPPGGRRSTGASRRRVVDYDAVLLTETHTVADAEAVLAEPRATELVRDLQRQSERTLAFAASNTRRIAPVDHGRQGDFLFNYFDAADLHANLLSWQYTAGWFQNETGLDNATVLQPVDPHAVPHTVVNHCRWDRLRDVLPSLALKPIFRSFVLSTFDRHDVVPNPLLFRLHSAR